MKLEPTVFDYSTLPPLFAQLPRAADYRKEISKPADAGYVFFFGTLISGWSQELAKSFWSPGTIAIDHFGNRWVAIATQEQYREAADQWKPLHTATMVVRAFRESVACQLARSLDYKFEEIVRIFWACPTPQEFESSARNVYLFKIDPKHYDAINNAYRSIGYFLHPLEVDEVLKA